MLRREGEDEDGNRRSTRRRLVGGPEEEAPDGGDPRLDGKKFLDERLDQIDKRRQARFNAFRTWVAPGLVFRRDGAPNILTVQMFRGTSPTVVRIETPSR